MRKRFLIVLMFLLASAGKCFPTPQPFTFEDKLPYEAQWGRYRIAVDGEKSPDDLSTRFRVFDAAGRMVKEIGASGASISRVDFPDLSGRGQGEELRVVTHPGNNRLANIHTYCFTRQGGLIHNILSMPGEFSQYQDLDGDGRPELIDDDFTALEWVAETHAASPSVLHVLRWNGCRYTVADRQFPKEIKRGAYQWRKRYVELKDDPESGWTYILGAMLGYWAHCKLLDEGPAARHWIDRHPIPTEQRRWPFVRSQFLEKLPATKERLHQWSLLVTTDQRRIIHAPSYLDPDPDDS